MPTSRYRETNSFSTWI